MKIHLTRESVCAGDDIDFPHTKIIYVSADSSITELMQIIKSKYLPSNIQGGEATWSVVSDIPVAIIAQQWSVAKLIPPFRHTPKLRDSIVDLNRLHANYHTNIDPDLVYEVLSMLRFPKMIE